MKSPDFILRVLQAFDRADSYDSLFWKARVDEPIRFFANCSDLFYWATADAEEILPEDLPLLEQTLEELIEIDERHLLAELFCARKRGMRPQGACYRGMYGFRNPEVRTLFDACGPERETDLWNPKSQETQGSYGG